MENTLTSSYTPVYTPPMPHNVSKVAKRKELFQGFLELDGQVQKDCTKLLKLSIEAFDSMADALGKYVKLVLFIRSSQLPRNLVTQTLDSAKYNQPRISEICRVAYGPQDVLEKLQKNVIGFKTAIKLLS